MGIYCKSISPELKQFILQPKILSNLLPSGLQTGISIAKQIGNIATILNLQTAILTFINDKLAA